MRTTINRIFALLLTSVITLPHCGCISGPFRSATVGQQRSATVKWTEDAPWWAVPFAGTAGAVTDVALVPLDTVTVVGWNSFLVVASPITNATYVGWNAEEDAPIGGKIYFATGFACLMTPFISTVTYPCSIAEMFVAWDYWDDMWGNRTECDIEEALSNRNFNKAYTLATNGHGTLPLFKGLMIKGNASNGQNFGDYSLKGVYDELSDEAWRTVWKRKVADARQSYINMEENCFVAPWSCLSREEYMKTIEEYLDKECINDEDIGYFTPAKGAIRNALQLPMVQELESNRIAFRERVYTDLRGKLHLDQLDRIIESVKEEVEKVSELEHYIDTEWGAFRKTFTQFSELVHALQQNDIAQVEGILATVKTDTKFPVLEMPYTTFTQLSCEMQHKLLSQTLGTDWVEVAYPVEFSAYSNKVIDLALQVQRYPWAFPVALSEVNHLTTERVTQMLDASLITLDMHLLKDDAESVNEFKRIGEKWGKDIERRIVHMALPSWESQELSAEMFDYLTGYESDPVVKLLVQQAIYGSTDAEKAHRLGILFAKFPEQMTEGITPNEAFNLLAAHESNPSSVEFCTRLRALFKRSRSSMPDRWNALALKSVVKDSISNPQKANTLKALCKEIRMSTQQSAFWMAMTEPRFIRDMVLPNVNLARFYIELGCVGALSPVCDDLPPIVHVIAKGDTEICRLFMDSFRIDVNQMHAGRTLVGVAIDNDTFDTLKLLVENYSASLEVPCKKGSQLTPLAYAKACSASNEIITYLCEKVGVLDIFAGIEFGKTYAYKDWLGISYPDTIELGRPFRGITKAKLFRTPTTKRVYAVKLEKSIYTDSNNREQSIRLLNAESDGICSAIKIRYQGKYITTKSKDLGIISEHHKKYFIFNDELHIEVDTDNGFFTSGRGDITITATYLPLQEEAVREQRGNAEQDAEAL